MAALLRAAGDVGRDLAAVRWEATPLGPPSGWPQSLRTAVSILVSSRFSMWMAWGPQLTFFCNAAYRRDTLGAKYPWALGRPANEVWAEIWPDIGPRIDRVVSTGEATWDEALLLFLERSGYREETYHTFSYSPLRDDAGTVAGMLCVVSEETERVIASRRMATLRDLGSGSAAVAGETEILGAACRKLGENARDFPFAALYLFDPAGGDAHLAGAAGLPPGHPAAPRVLAAGDPGAPWLAAAAVAGESSAAVDLAGFADLPTGDWTEPPTKALVVPLVQQGTPHAAGFLVAGLNRYRPLDADYRSFVELAAGKIAADLAGARAYEQERRRAEALAELDAAKTAFFTNVSHELRTPLTLMLGPTEDALADVTDPPSPRQRDRLERVLRNEQRLLTLVNTLLDFARIDARRVAGAFEPTDLARYTGELASMFHSAAAEVGLEFTVDAAPLPEPAYVDREMWAKIVLNLLSNAMKFTLAGGVTVRLAAVDGAAALSVADTGVGIEPAEQARLFQRFHRVAGTRARTHEGTGIGLALVAELAALHGGTVAVESSPGRGSTFTVRIPFGTGHLPPEQVLADPRTPSASLPAAAQGYLAEVRRWSSAAGSAADRSGTAPAAEDSRPAVLVADDNADMRDYVAGLLSDDFRVATAVDGADALEQARARPPDLVLTDVMMPRLDGFGLLAALRADPATAEVPVVMLSARAGEDGVVQGLRAGADDYLGKPFGAQELLARVRANVELDRARRARDRLQRSQELLDQAQRLAQVGSWEVDLATGRVSGSPNLLRILGSDPGQLEAARYPSLLDHWVHPTDRPRVTALLAAAEDGDPIRFETRIVGRDGRPRTVRVRGETIRDDSGRPVRMRGSIQDVTEQRETEERLAAAAAAREAAGRERRVAEELQASLLPERVLHPEHLQVATYYRAGVEGTYVGGDWYDVIELGAGRAALVIGDVMGRGVRAAAVMGQLRSAVRAYARLDLRPGHLLELCDGIVRDLGEDHIVTCVYMVYDPIDGILTFANAGHLPPLLVAPGAAPRLLSGAGGPPLGAGPLTVPEQRIPMPAGTLVALYTDGLVERRGRSLDEGLAQLAAGLPAGEEPLQERVQPLVESLLPGGLSDDVAVLLARVPPESALPPAMQLQITEDARAVGHARRFVAATLRDWQVRGPVVDDAVLLASELVTNALLHGRPPVELRLGRGASAVVAEVRDGASYLPRRLRPTPEDEHGRGIQLVDMLADRWGSRPTSDGKAVWCTLNLDRDRPAGGRADGGVPSREQ